MVALMFIMRLTEQKKYGEEKQSDDTQRLRTYRMEKTMQIAADAAIGSLL